MIKYIFLKIIKGVYYIFELKFWENKLNVWCEFLCELIWLYIIVNWMWIVVVYCKI